MVTQAELLSASVGEAGGGLSIMAREMGDGLLFPSSVSWDSSFLGRKLLLLKSLLSMAGTFGRSVLVHSLSMSELEFTFYQPDNILSIM